MKLSRLLIILLIGVKSFSQELPPIEKFTPEVYMGDNQNWMITQSENKFLYVANNKGLLEFNGANWATYPSPNNTIVRAVNVIDDKIYMGCYAEFGYWKKNKLGHLKYTSLTSKIDEKLLEEEQIWNILEYNEWVIFQSSTNIYFYNTNTDTFKIITATDNIYKIFKLKNRIYYHVAHQGIYLIQDGAPTLIIDDPIIQSKRVINIFEKDDALIMLTRNSGFYKFYNEEITPWRVPADKLLKEVNIFSSIQLRDESFMIGTISDGVLHLTNEGVINYQITQKKGLSNNTVLSLFEDKDSNVWAGLDNGINAINVPSAIQTFFDYEGVLGTVYTTQLFKDYLYIGSNQGLFYRKLSAVNDAFKFVPGSAGQVWDLFNYNDEYLFCGHHLGTFLVNEHKIQKISEFLGAWTFKKVPDASNLLLQGNYNGLYILEKSEDTWNVRNKITGFKNSSRYLEIDDQKQVWINHEYKGVFKLTLNDSLTNVLKIKKEPNLPLGKNTSLIKYKNTILYASEKGIYSYNPSKEIFKRDSILSTVIEDGNYITGKLVVDKNERLWAFSKDNISYLENDAISNNPIIKNIPIPSKLRKGVLGFENISLVNETKYVLGTANGYITLDLSKQKNTTDHFIYLNSVALENFEGISAQYPIDEPGQFKYKQGLLSFKYSVPEYNKYLDVKYQYLLDGVQTKWTKWTENPEVTFENLSFGNYTLKIRSKVGNELSSNSINYTFVVDRPWYISNTAFLFYFILLIIIGLITHRTYKNFYVKKFMHEQLENEQKIMQIKNEQLNQDIESKNRELAISTMSIIKKNEVLNSIKKALKKSGHTDRAALKLIDSNLNDSKDWSFFEQAFNNADKDFLDKIKKSHPDLTPNDLRFCAYLRLNLSSKEMAPLLNISIKSVETKRYRLRKKLNLAHDNSLINYILKF